MCICLLKMHKCKSEKASFGSYSTNLLPVKMHLSLHSFDLLRIKRCLLKKSRKLIYSWHGCNRSMGQVGFLICTLQQSSFLFQGHCEQRCGMVSQTNTPQLLERCRSPLKRSLIAITLYWATQGQSRKSVVVNFFCHHEKKSSEKATAENLVLLFNHQQGLAFFGGPSEDGLWSSWSPL